MGKKKTLERAAVETGSTEPQRLQAPSQQTKFPRLLLYLSECRITTDVLPRLHFSEGTKDPWYRQKVLLITIICWSPVKVTGREARTFNGNIRQMFFSQAKSCQLTCRVK